MVSLSKIIIGSLLFAAALVGNFGAVDAGVGDGKDVSFQMNC